MQAIQKETAQGSHVKSTADAGENLDKAQRVVMRYENKTQSKKVGNLAFKREQHCQSFFDGITAWN